MIWLSRPRLSTVAPYSPSDLSSLDSLADAPAYAGTTGVRYTPPCASSAQTTLAILLANATLTSIGGLRASMRPSQEPAGTPFRQLATALAPIIKSRPSVRSPIFDVLPNLSLPPLDC